MNDQPTMNTFDAAMIAEGAWELTGFEPDEETYFTALQHLIDSGLNHTLQGSVGRACAGAIANGHCHA
jgi:hypothetical protein